MVACFRNILFLTVFSLFLVFAALEQSGCVAAGRENGPLVNSRLGKIRGKVQRAAQGTKVYAFTGVPFAEPPIGELRYRKPQPVKPWGENVLDATKYPPSCMQANVFDPIDIVWIPYERPKSEDCLYLNIWAPVLGKEKRLPVIAWIHGGSYVQGSAAMWLDDGGNLAALGNVVVVNIAYRLQSYGLLYDGTDEAPGNQLFYDQVLALQWVQDNIADFGGNPDEVTLLGFSVGGASVDFHLLSPGSKNLFKRAIVHSGSSTNQGAKEDKQEMFEKSNKFAGIFGCRKGSENETKKASTTVSCLRSVNASLLTSIEKTATEQIISQFLPIFGDEFLPVNPSTAVYPGDKDVIMGHLANEGSVLLYKYFSDTFSSILPPRKINKVEMVHYLANFYISKLPLSDILRLQKMYMESIGDFDYDGLRQALVDIVGDERIICGTYETARKIANSTSKSQSGNRIYVYRMNYVSACIKRQPWFGMTHGDDLPFVFGRPFDLNAGCRKDVPFSRNIIKLWTNFANGRKPTESTGIEWPEFTPTDMAVLEMAGRTFEISRHRSDRCEILKEMNLF